MKKFTHPGTLIIIGFVVMLLLMSFLIFKTMQQNFELINEDFYTQEKRVNEKQLWLKNTQHLVSDISIEQQANELQIKLPASVSTDITQGSVKLYALAEKKYDTSFTIDPSTTGFYTINIAELPKISYIAKLKFTAHDSTFYKEVSLKLYQP